LKTVAIIQARFNSSRLPGKVLMEVKNKPLLLHMYERVIASNEIDQVIIATSNQKSDEGIIEFCKLNKIEYFCGSLDDVLDRYYQAAKITNANLVVRLTGDCPIIDPKVIDSVINIYKNENYDFVANTAPPEGLTYPEGMDVEVFSMSALEEAWNNAKKPSEREHVTFYFWKNLDKFKCFRADLTYNYSHYRLTVDYLEDFVVVSSIIEKLYSREHIFSMEDILRFLDLNPEIYEINNNIESFSGWNESLAKDLDNKFL
jgi:spore coat polysaccharide biosynthesis protein SpsF (cytidylyltransferase family)